jgi:hypothetical protein
MSCNDVACHWLMKTSCKALARSGGDGCRHWLGNTPPPTRSPIWTNASSNSLFSHASISPLTNRQHGSTRSRRPFESPKPKLTTGCSRPNGTFTPSSLSAVDPPNASLDSETARPAPVAPCRTITSSHFERPHCDSACNATGVGRLFLGVDAGRAR